MLGIIAYASKQSSDEFMHLRSLTFSARIQNISTFSRHRHAIHLGFYCMCEQRQLRRVCANHLLNLTRTFATVNVLKLRTLKNNYFFRCS